MVESYYWVNMNKIFVADNIDLLTSDKLLEFENKIKVIYIDPPYNTKSTKSYNDNENSHVWLSNIITSIRASYKYLSENGVVPMTDEIRKEIKTKNKEFADEVIKKLKDLTKSRIEGCKRIANLIVALAVLPVACSLLNWIYPRFMAAVFPNLSNKKHGNESQELVDKATKNQEVK